MSHTQKYAKTVHFMSIHGSVLMAAYYKLRSVAHAHCICQPQCQHQPMAACLMKLFVHSKAAIRLLMLRYKMAGSHSIYIHPNNLPHTCTNTNIYSISFLYMHSKLNHAQHTPTRHNSTAVRTARLPMCVLITQEPETNGCTQQALLLPTSMHCQPSGMHTNTGDHQ